MGLKRYLKNSSKKMAAILINEVANFLMCVSVTMFYVYLYGDKSKVVHRWSFVGHWTLKLGLIGIIIGSALNVLTLSDPPLTEVVLNAGLALTFVWAYLFHRKMFDAKK